MVFYRLLSYSENKNGFRDFNDVGERVCENFHAFSRNTRPRTVALHHAKALQLNSYPYFS